jgi:carboxymethylenebutenolidase
VARLEKGGARDLLIERSRNVMCEALMEVVREQEGETMSLEGAWIRHGEGSGYFAKPAKATGLPGVLVIQEIAGVNAHIEDVTRRVAAAGYAALAPDLYVVDGRRPEALTADRIAEAFGFAAALQPGTMLDPASREAALAKLGAADSLRIKDTFGEMFAFAAPGRAESLMGPLSRAFRHLHEERAETRGRKIACVGFCMGGGLSARLACDEPEVSGAAIFYGMAPPGRSPGSRAR